MNKEKRYKYLPLAETGRLSESDTKKYFSTLGYAVSAFLLATLGASLVISVICQSRFPWVLENDILSNIISLICQYGIGLPALLAVLSKLPKDVNPKEKLGFGRFMGFFCLSITFMTVGSNISSSLMSGIEELLGRSVANPVDTMTASSHWAVNIVFYVIIAPVLEELVFRKIVCDRLLPMGELTAVILSAALFGLSHGNFYQFFYAFFVGAIFSYIYIKTGSVIYTMIMHIMINLICGIFAPWLYGEIAPLLTEEFWLTVSELAANGDLNGFIDLIRPFSLPFSLVMLYSTVMNAFSIVGFVLLMKNLRRIRFADGLLRPAKENIVSNFFLNGGVCSAIALFVGAFIISLFAK